MEKLEFPEEDNDSADELLAEMREFASQRNGNGLEDPEDAWAYQSAFRKLDDLCRRGFRPEEWQ